MYQSGNNLFSTSFNLTVKMSNLTDKHSSKRINSDKTMHLSTTKRSEIFSDKNIRLENSFLTNKTNTSCFTDMLPRQSSVTYQTNHLFKVPNLDCLPVKKASAKSIISPHKGVQRGRVKNDLKLSQQSKMSLIPLPSFINSRKSLHLSRRNQVNARKELIKKMVFLAECNLKENKDLKQSTPVKPVRFAGLTPKKTPRSGGYFIIPEFNKKIPKLEDIISPIEDLNKTKMLSYLTKRTPLIDKINEISQAKPNEVNVSDFIVKPKEFIQRNNSPYKRFTTILCDCKKYSEDMSQIHENLRTLDSVFETKLKNIPDYKIYNEFCLYECKKEELYKRIQILDKKLKDSFGKNTKIGSKLEDYIKKKQNHLDELINLHKNLEEALAATLKNEDEKIEENKPKIETPPLRRSLRLSKIKKSKCEERTPMTKKLKKLDSKSKRIAKSGKKRSP